MPPFIRENRFVSTAVALVTALVWLLALPESIDDTWNRTESILDVLWKNPIALVGFICTLGLAVLINWDLIETHLLGKTKERWPTEADLERDVATWLRSARFTLQDLPLEDRNANPGIDLSFGFVATDPFQRPVYVLKVRSIPVIRLQVSVRASKEKNHLEIMRTMSEAQRATMMEDIGIELARSGVSFQAGDLATEKADGGVNFSDAIPVTDTLTNVQVVNRALLMSRLTLVVQLLATRHVRQVGGDVEAVNDGGKDQEPLRLPSAIETSS